MGRVDKILIVDDYVDNVDLLAKRFRSLGYQVLEAYDGDQALAIVESQEPDLIVLDVMMPRMDGFEVTRRLKLNPKTRPIPVILLTAKKDVPDKIKGLDTGADDYVTKPFNPRELVARVKGLLARRDSDKRLAAAEKLGALGQMAEGVAHEVRNPMVAIGGFARRIRDRLPEGDVLKDYAEHIIKEVERLESMVAEIVKFKTVIISPYEKVDLRALIDEVVNVWAKRLEGSSVRAEVDFEPETPEISGDAENLRLAMSNLLQNAVEAMPSGGDVKISCGTAKGRDGWIALSVADSGVGIQRGDLANVFDPFFTSKMSGAGMGLTMVHRIVTRHGGEVDIESEPGKGTTITISLPVHQELSI